MLSLATYPWISVISVPLFCPDIWRKGHCGASEGPSSELTADEAPGWVEEVRGDHMIWGLQPLFWTHAQNSSPPDFWEVLPSAALLCSHNLAIIRKGRRSGFSLSLDPFQPAVLPLLRFLPVGPKSCFLPSLPRLSSPALWWGMLRFQSLSSPPDGQVQIPKAQLCPWPSDQRRSDLLASIKAHLSVTPPCDSMLVTS